MIRRFASFAVVWDLLVIDASEGTECEDNEHITLLQATAATQTATKSLHPSVALVDQLVDLANEGRITPEEAIEQWEQQGAASLSLLQRAEQRSSGATRENLDKYVARKGDNQEPMPKPDAPICNYYLHTLRGTPGRDQSDCDFLLEYEKFRQEAEVQMSKLVQKYKKLNEILVNMGRANTVRQTLPEIPNMWDKLSDTWDGTSGIESICKSDNWNPKTWKTTWGPYLLCEQYKMPSCEDELHAIFAHTGVDLVSGCAAVKVGNMSQVNLGTVHGFEIFPGSWGPWVCTKTGDAEDACAQMEKDGKLTTTTTTTTTSTTAGTTKGSSTKPKVDN